MDFTKWHKVAVRVQDTQSMLRIFVDDEMVSVYPFKQQIVAYPRDAQLRLAQIFEVYLENTGVITSRFKVSQYKGKLRVFKLDERSLNAPAKLRWRNFEVQQSPFILLIIFLIKPFIW